MHFILMSFFNRWSNPCGNISNQGIVMGNDRLSDHGHDTTTVRRTMCVKRPNFAGGNSLVSSVNYG